MGRGDKKTKKGKIFMGSFGKVRPARIAKPVVADKKEEAEVKEKPVKKEAATKESKEAATKED